MQMTAALVFHADSSINWTKPTDGLNTTQFYGVDKMPGGSAYIGGMQDNGTWRSPENITSSSNWNFSNWRRWL